MGRLRAHADAAAEHGEGGPPVHAHQGLRRQGAQQEQQAVLRDPGMPEGHQPRLAKRDTQDLRKGRTRATSGAVRCDRQALQDATHQGSNRGRKEGLAHPCSPQKHGASTVRAAAGGEGVYKQLITAWPKTSGPVKGLKVPNQDYRQTAPPGNGSPR